jgi:uncharacterized protein (TIGR02117 family)
MHDFRNKTTENILTGLARSLLLAATLLVAGCATTPYALDAPQAERGEPRRNRIFAVAHGWHVGVVVPQPYLADKMPELKARFPNSRYIEIGWGDKGFSQAKDVTIGLTLEAMFWSSGAVIHAVGLPPSSDPPFDYFPKIDTVEVCVSDRELNELSEFIHRSFVADAQGRLTPMRPGLYGDSQFYEAEGRYHLLNTCNKWVAKGLASMGMSIDPIFMLTASSVFEALQDSGRVTRASANGMFVAPRVAPTACDYVSSNMLAHRPAQ